MNPELLPAPRQCTHCNRSLEGMRSNAVYCSRTCKVKASDQRRREDGRSRTRDRARYEKESDHRRKYAREYCNRFPEKTKENKRRRKARLNDVPRYRITDKDWNRLVARFSGCCAYCGDKSSNLQREHVIPISRGGSHGVGNIVPACAPCNYSKGPSLVMEWRKRGGFNGVPGASS